MMGQGASVLRRASAYWNEFQEFCTRGWRFLLVVSLCSLSHVICMLHEFVIVLHEDMACWAFAVSAAVLSF